MTKTDFAELKDKLTKIDDELAIKNQFEKEVTEYRYAVYPDADKDQIQTMLADCGCHGYFDAVEVITEIRIAKIGVFYCFVKSSNWIDEEDLQLYTEPKPKVKKWLYLVKYRNRKSEEIFFRPYTEDQAKNRYNENVLVEWFQRLDWSMTEVDE